MRVDHSRIELVPLQKEIGENLLIFCLALCFVHMRL